MSQHIDLIIPIRSYLKKFISYEVEVEPAFTLSLSRCPYSAIILEPIKKSYVKTNLKDFKNLDDELRIRMTPSVMKENKYTIDDHTVMSIDNRLKALFDHQLCAHVTMLRSERGDIKDRILNFMDFYGITEDDLKYETVIKMYYRARYGVPSQKQERMDEVISYQTSLFGK